MNKTLKNCHLLASTRSLTASALALLISAGMASGLTSCTNDDLAEPQPGSGSPLTLTIHCAVGGKSTNPADTRASVDYGGNTTGEKFRWNAHDSFNAYLLNTTGNTWVKNADGNALAPVPFTIGNEYDDTTPSNKADFTGTFAAAGTYQMLALYPATVSNGTTASAFTPPATAPADGAETAFTFTVPATTQTQNGGTTTHLKDNMLMWATTTSAVTVSDDTEGTATTAPDLSFHHLTAMMRFTVKNKNVFAYRITAIRVTGTGNAFGTEGTLTQAANPWGAAPTVAYTADKTVNTISLVTKDADDATKGFPLAAESSTSTSTLDAYLLTLPGADLAGQKLTFSIDVTDDAGGNPHTFTTRELDAQAIIDANPGATTFEAGKRYWFDLDFNAGSLSINSFTVGSWAQGEDISMDNSFGIRLASTTADGVNTYEIANAAGLKAFADIVNGTDNGQPRTIYGINIPATPTDEARKSNARLVANIDLTGVCSAASGRSWTPIGKTLDKPYQGTFEGNYYTVRGLYINDEQSAADLTADANLCQGLFGTLSNATVENLIVEGSIRIGITDKTGEGILYIYAGGIAGLTGNRGVAGSGSTLANCHSAVSVAATFGGNTTAHSEIYAGGIAGYAWEGSLSDCSSSGAVSVTVTASGRSSAVIAGGICGRSQDATLTGCSHPTGDVSGSALNGAVYTGGVVGLVESNTDVQLLGCTNGAAVSGNGSDLYIGGVAGMSYAPVVACRNSGTISYSAGSGLYAGGVVGESDNIVVASISTEIPKLEEGGNTPGTKFIGGIIGAINESNSPASTCFYAADADCGTDGIGDNSYSSSPVVNCGRVATPAELNAKVEEMNTAIVDYNNGTITGTGITITPPATKCPYRWKQSAAGGAPELGK